MKKLVAFMLAVLMAASLLSVASAESKVYNVVNLVNGNLGDKSFFDSAEAGLKQLADAGRITYKTIEMGGADSDQPTWLSTLYDVSDSGEYDLVICGTYQMPDYLKEVAEQYPDQKYLIYDDTTYVGECENIVNISFRQNDLGYLCGVLKTSAFVGGATALGLALLGVRDALLLGLFMGIFELLPYVGPVLASVPILLSTLPQGIYPSALALALVIAVQQVEGNFVSPYFTASSTSIDPLTAVVSVFVLGSLFGLWGILLAVPLVVTARSLLWSLRHAQLQPGR